MKRWRLLEKKKNKSGKFNKPKSRIGEIHIFDGKEYVVCGDPIVFTGNKIIDKFK